MARNGKASRRDIYAEVTDRIVEALESGVVPWVRPWRSLGASGDLRNGHSGHAYSGINTLLLGLEMDSRGYSDSRWVTFKQSKSLGGHAADPAEVSEVEMAQSVAEVPPGLPFVPTERGLVSGNRTVAVHTPCCHTFVPGLKTAGRRAV